MLQQTILALLWFQLKKHNKHNKTILVMYEMSTLHIDSTE